MGVGRYGNAEMGRLLVQSGAGIGVRDAAGFTAGDDALDNGHPDFIEAIHAAGNE